MAPPALSRGGALCWPQHSKLTPSRSHDLRHRRGKRNDVVTDLRLNLLDAFQFEVGALANRLGCLLWDHTGLGQRLRRGHLYSQPGAKTVVFAPDFPHFGTRIARYQRPTPSS